MNDAGALAAASTGVRAVRFTQAMAMTAIAWGVLAFGGAYPWAYWPLAAIAGTTGAMAVYVCRSPQAAAMSRTVAIGLCAIGLAIALQIVPLPLAWVEKISPSSMPLIANIDFAVGAGVTRYHSLSVDPRATAAALSLYACFALFVVGLIRLFALEHPRRLAEALTVLAVVLALAGIVQKPLYNGKLLGFWGGHAGTNPFGPFVNKNHFAGWMLMALPLTLALLCAGLEQGMRGLKPGWRYRILWLSSPEANRLILIGAAAGLMALSLVLTMSRSGISALMMSLVLTGWIVARGLKGRTRRAAGALYLMLLAGTAVTWAGADAIVARFSSADWTEFNDRRGAWLDALGVFSAFPATGAGVNTYETVARFYQRHDLAYFYGESHNDYLELLADGGLLVGIPVVMCALFVAVEIRRRMKADPPSTAWWLRRGAITALIAIGFQETVEFSLQMPGNAVLFALVLAIALHDSRGARGVRTDVAPRGAIESRTRLRVVASNPLAESR